MSNELWASVDRYLAELYLPPDPALDAALADSTAAGLPPINVQPAQGKFLKLIAEIHRARTILEIGTLGGYSTIWLARALPNDGKLVTLEIDEAYARIARANIARAGLSDIVDLRVGPAKDTLPRLAAEGRGPFDLIFIDADKPNYTDYFDWALKLSRVGTVIIADNVIRDGGVADPASPDPKVQGIQRFNRLVASDPRVSATTIQTVGQKGYDGFAIMRVV